MTIFDRTKKTAIPHSLASVRGLLSSSALTAAGFVVFVSSPALADPAPWSQFADEAGSISIDTSTPNLTNILQHTDRYIGTSGYLSIPQGYTVNITQNGSGALFAAKAAIGADPTRIMGALHANGNVLIIDHNGVFFGRDSEVDVGGLVATTGDIGNDQILNKGFGDYTIENIDGNPIARIDLQGHVNISGAGLAAFVAPTVVNSGVINARMGKVGFASGAKVTMDPYGDNLFEIEVPSDVAARIENTGAVKAEGGIVQMSTETAAHVVDNMINVDGLVSVASAEVKGGKIVLSAGKTGTVAVKGKLDATGQTGGDITVTGEAVTALDGAVLDASGNYGGGDIRFGGAYQGGGNTPRAQYAYVAQNAILRSDAKEEGDGGDVVVWADVGTGFHGLITANGAKGGKGGSVETSGKKFLQALGSVSAGEWLLDPHNLTVVDTIDLNTTITDIVGLRTVEATGAVPADQSRVTDDVIEAALNNGTNVTLKTGALDAQDGDLVVNAQIDKTAGGDATLRLEAHDDIWVNEDIVSTVGALNVELISQMSGPSNAVVLGSNISTNGGDFTSFGDKFFMTPAAQIDTAGGDVTVDTRTAKLFAGATIDANSGNILMNNTGIFTSALPDALLTHGTGTIDVNQTVGGSIQTAIDAVHNTGTGLNTVHVGAGTFAEDLSVVDDNMRLAGANAGVSGNAVRGAETIITPTSIGFAVTGDHVTVDGFKILGGDTGVHLDHANDAVVENNVITDSAVDGVYVKQSDRARVSRNAINNALDNGIQVFLSDDVVIGGNDVADGNIITANGILSNNHNGISAVYVDRILIGQNTVNQYRWDGISLRFGDDVQILNNTVNDGARSGLAVRDTLDGIVSGNTVNNAGTWGIYSRSNDGITIADNTIDNAAYDGIYHFDATGPATISGNTVTNAGWDGINVLNSAFTTVGGALLADGNTITGAGRDGVHLETADDAVVQNNVITDSAVDGVYLKQSDRARVASNTINNALDNGIQVFLSDDVVIGGNDVADGNIITANGISANNHSGISAVYADRILIGQNTVNAARWDGISLRFSTDAQVSNNEVNDSVRSGLALRDTVDALVEDNTLDHAGTWGIYSRSNDGITIADNTIDAPALDGIYHFNATGPATMRGNTILSAGQNGINVLNSAFVTIGGLLLADINTITGAAQDGVYLEGADDAVVENNVITDSAVDGVYVKQSDRARVASNTINNALDNGIQVFLSDDVVIGGNDVADGNIITANGILSNNHSGISAVYVDRILIGQNTVNAARWDGISLRFGDDVQILNNTVDDAARSGLAVRDTLNGDVSDNTVNNAGAWGIYSRSNDGITIADNVIDTPVLDGIYHFDATGPATISGNTVTNAGWDGIHILRTGLPAVNSAVTDNTITLSAVRGLYVEGEGHGTVTVSGNTFTDNPVGARFESGAIDISDLLNPNHFVNTVLGATPVGLEFDQVGVDSESLTIVGQTLGNTIFEGFQTLGSYYVYITDGSILDPLTGDPIVIDGLSATFDGIQPLLTAGILNASNFNFIENRLHDADDGPVNGRGQIFVGTVPAPAAFTIDNIEDFFNQFRFFSFGPSGFDVTITGLPPVGGPVLNLPDISPAAGGDDNLAGIEPAAGGDDNLAGIEPAAGGNTPPEQPQGEQEDVSCWGDAMSAAQNGGSVNITFGGTLEDSLADAGACKTSAL